MKRIPRDSYRVLKYIYNAPNHSLHENHVYEKFGHLVANFALNDLRKRQLVTKFLPAYFDLPRNPEDDLLSVTEAGEYFLMHHKRKFILSIAASAVDFLLSFLPWKPKSADLLRTIFHNDSEI